MNLRLFPLVLFGALAFGATAPQLAQAKPIDLDAEEEEEEAEEEDPFADLGAISRGDIKADLPTIGEQTEGELIIDDEFEEPIEEFFEGIPDDDEFPEESDNPAQRERLVGNFEDLPEEGVEDDFKRPKRGSDKGPGPISIDVAGKQPLSDNYPLEVVAVDRDAVVVELPVLLARSRVEVETGFLVYAEVYVGDERVTEVRQVVEESSVAEFGPSFAFLKLLAPVVEPQGQIKVKVFRADLDGGNREELFTRITPYALR